MKSSIVVVGSTNTDMVVKTSRLPLPGETILGGHFLMNAGGKGANQAVAAARLGGAVTFIAKTGEDVFGQTALRSFKSEGINTEYITADKQNPSGVALITVDGQGENCIVVAPGANARLSGADVRNGAAAIENAGLVLLQLEVPLEVVLLVAQMAAVHGVRTILNPAPACPLPDELWRHISVLTPNEKEAEVLSGISILDLESAGKAARALCNKGASAVIITLGAAGALVCDDKGETLVPAPNVTAVDTTAAGDVFNGALAVALAEGSTLSEAALFAVKAAALSVTRLGAQASAPYRNEVDANQLVKKDRHAS
jgi:ribokinase